VLPSPPPPAPRAGDGPNEAALRGVVAMIELHPERWYQGTFWSDRPGGTTHCVAAWAVKLAGQDLLGMLRRDPSGRTVYREARRLLGLTDEQARRLFEWAKNDEHKRHPTVDGLKARVRVVTGVGFKGQEWCERG
jgi:hypothetical protein